MECSSDPTVTCPVATNETGLSLKVAYGECRQRTDHRAGCVGLARIAIEADQGGEQ